MNEFFKGVGIAVTAIVALAMLLFISPVIYIGFGYLGGLIVKWVFGGVVTDGLNTLFGTQRFTPSSIPLITAALAMIGSYFKSSLTTKKEK